MLVMIRAVDSKNFLIGLLSSTFINTFVAVKKYCCKDTVFYCNFSIGHFVFGSSRVAVFQLSKTTNNAGRLPPT